MLLGSQKKIKIFRKISKKNLEKIKIFGFLEITFFEKLFFEKLAREVAQQMRGGLGTGLSTLAPLEVLYQNF